MPTGEKLESVLKEWPNISINIQVKRFCKKQVNIRFIYLYFLDEISLTVDSKIMKFIFVA